MSATSATYLRVEMNGVLREWLRLREIPTEYAMNGLTYKRQWYPVSFWEGTHDSVSLVAHFVSEAQTHICPINFSVTDEYAPDLFDAYRVIGSVSTFAVGMWVDAYMESSHVARIEELADTYHTWQSSLLPIELSDLIIGTSSPLSRFLSLFKRS